MVGSSKATGELLLEPLLEAGLLLGLEEWAVPAVRARVRRPNVFALLLALV